MARPGVMMYFDVRNGLQNLSVASRCAVYDAILYYGEFGVVPEFEDPMAKMAWDMLQPRIDKDRQAYEKRRAKRAKPDVTEENLSNQTVPENSAAEQNTNEHNTTEHNTNEHNTNEHNTNQINTNQTSTTYPSAAPTYQEVESYCRKNKLRVNPRQFVDYYSANGWMIGQNPMADWKAALRSWEKNKKEYGNGFTGTYSTALQQFGPIGTRL